ncbi:MAG: hypothetical protein PUB20_04030 [Clostridia bacterium]|nr:hypothetical protein [Clostridia bacterium]
MKNTVIRSIVAVLCSAAICVTMALTLPKMGSADADKEYMTASETAEYLGITEEVLEIMRVDLKKLEGSYMSYTYVNDKGDTVTEIIYQKAALDEDIKAIMESAGAINLEFLQNKNSK